MYEAAKSGLIALKTTGGVTKLLMKQDPSAKGDKINWLNVYVSDWNDNGNGDPIVVGPTGQEPIPHPEMWNVPDKPDQYASVGMSDLYAGAHETAVAAIKLFWLKQVVLEWKPIPTAEFEGGALNPSWISLAASAVDTDNLGLPEVVPPPETKEAVKAPHPGLAVIKSPDGTQEYHPRMRLSGITDIEELGLLAGQYHALYIGPAGYGKTALGEAFANWENETISFTRDSDTVTMYGQEAFDVNKGTYFKWSGLCRAVMHRHDETCSSPCGKDKVIGDELNAADPALLVALHSLLDHRRYLELPGGQRLEAGDGFMFIGGINPELGPLEDALQSRLGQAIWVGPDWDLVKQLGVDDDIAAVVRIIHEKKEMNLIKAAVAPGIRQMLRFTQELTMYKAASDDKKAAVQYVIDGFLGKDVPEIDHHEITQAVGGVFSITPHPLGRGGR